MKAAKVILTSLTALLLLGIGSHWLYLGEHSPLGWEEDRIPFHDKHTAVIYMTKRAHYFLAEYHQKIQVKDQGNVNSLKTIRLPLRQGNRVKVYSDSSNFSLYFVEDNSNVTILKISESCAQTTIKDPGIKGDLCPNWFVKRESLNLSQMNLITHL